MIFAWSWETIHHILSVERISINTPMPTIHNVAWLRDRGFRTFTHYFDWVDIENQIEDGVQDSIVAVIKRLATMSNQELTELYRTMRPDLLHNQQRFQEFVQEQTFKIENLF